MIGAGSGRATRTALLAWLALAASIACWPLAGTSVALAALAGLPLLLPIAGLARGTARTLRWAPLTQAPALALAVTEVLANPPARNAASLTLALLLLAFAAVIAAQRAAARG
jgi:uncharacterized membrane protein